MITIQKLRALFKLAKAKRAMEKRLRRDGVSSSVAKTRVAEHFKGRMS